jgi:ethanolamine utilization protein EutQ (cupin superfamily)
VKTIHIKFNPFDGRTRSAREVFRQVQAERFKKANPKLVISHTLLNTAEAPSVTFKFVDGNEKLFDSQLFTAREMIDEVLLNTNQIDTQWQLEDKNIDDVA